MKYQILKLSINLYRQKAILFHKEYHKLKKIRFEKPTNKSFPMKKIKAFNLDKKVLELH